jgi:hypothetical protein
MAAADQLSALMNIISGIQGKSSTTKTSGGTTTQQTNVSDQGIQEILNQILSGSGGVKDVGSAARKSGLYNSTTEDSLLGQLYATAANKAELARSPTVTTTAPQTQTTKQDGVGLGTTAATLGGAFLASQALNLGSKVLSPLIESGANSVGSAITDLLGINLSGSDSGSGSGKGLLDNIDFGGYGGFGGTVGGGGTGFNAAEGYGINTSTLGSFNDSSSVPDAKGINFGMDLDTGNTSAGFSGFGALGGLLGSALSGLVGGSTGGGGGRSGGTSGGSVICTALKDRGLLDKDLHAKGEKYLSTLPAEVTIGYQSWAIAIAEKIEEGDETWTAICLPVARSRTALLASAGTFVDHLRYPLGTITKFLGEPICGLVGKAILSNNIFKVKGV